MKDIIVAFDVDRTLRDVEDGMDGTPVADEDLRTFLITWATFPGVLVHVWSGSGELYARQVARELGIAPYVHSYSHKLGSGLYPDIAFDDEDVELGHLNVKVVEDDDEEDSIPAVIDEAFLAGKYEE